MKTTLNISDVTMSRLKMEAARRGCTMSELVETALRTLLLQRPSQSELPTLPRFKTGGSRVNLASRDALYDAMDR